MVKPINTVIISILFLIVFMAGYWLRWSGKPYTSLLLNLHKLIALGSAVYLAERIYRLYQTNALTSDQMIWGVASGGLLLTAGLIGGVVSIDKPVHPLFGWLHNILPFVAILTLSVFLFNLS
jgi:hypothetical protein